MHEPTRLNGGQLTHAAHAGAGPRCDGAESHLAQLKPSATLRKPTCPRRAEGLREGAGEAALGREGAASAVALAHCSRARAREKCARLKRGVWGALVACRDRATHDKRRRVWDRGFSMKGTYLFMFLHPLTFSQDYMITSRIV